MTTVGKKEMSALKSAAAVYVITAEDIRRSGLTSLPELLRLAPGLSVGRIDASVWAISARGFNSRFANKMLVLIDGRTVYEPLFSGVLWEQQDVVLEDIERIEIVRGPGASLWGANAVNGIINIITRNARDTAGKLATAGTGGDENGYGLFRYGSAIGDGAFRVFAKYADSRQSLSSTGVGAGDGWHQARTGFRADLTTSPRDTVSVQGVLRLGAFDQTVTLASWEPPSTTAVHDTTTSWGGHLLGRWDRRLGPASSLSLQG